MKKALSLLVAFALTAGLGTSPAFAAETEEPDKSDQTRVIVTTDGECDDQNSMRHFLLYANDFDIAGIIYSASKFHFQGDGEGTTLREAVGTWTCEAEQNGLADDAGALTEFGPRRWAGLKT